MNQSEFVIIMLAIMHIIAAICGSACTFVGMMVIMRWAWRLGKAPGVDTLPEPAEDKNEWYVGLTPDERTYLDDK